MTRVIIEVPVVSEAIRKLGAPVAALVRADGFLFTCGMPPIDHHTGRLVIGDAAEQACAALDSLAFALQFAGSSLDKVVKATIYITDADLMAAVNAVYAGYFTGGFPARSFVAIKPWTAPFLLEIECVAAA